MLRRHAIVGSVRKVTVWITWEGYNHSRRTCGSSCTDVDRVGRCITVGASSGFRWASTVVFASCSNTSNRWRQKAFGYTNRAVSARSTFFAVRIPMLVLVLALWARKATQAVQGGCAGVYRGRAIVKIKGPISPFLASGSISTSRVGGNCHQVCSTPTHSHGTNSTCSGRCNIPPTISFVCAQATCFYFEN